MEKIGILIDSTCYISKEEINRYNIKVVPLNVIYEDNTYFETDISTNDVLTQLDKENSVKTANPSPALFLDKFNEFIEEGYTDVICFTLASGLSGTHQAARVASTMVDHKINIHLYDNNLAAFGIENVVLEVADHISNNESIEDILKITKEMFSNSKLMFTLSTLKYVIKGGRISKVAGTIGNLLKIKPIIEMIGGKLEITKKMRTTKKVLEYIESELNASIAQGKKVIVRLINLNNHESTQKLVNLLQSKYNNLKLTVTEYLGPVFTAHLGSEGFGITWTTI